MFGLFKSKKHNWQANIDVAGCAFQQIEVKAGNNLLKSALEAGIAWPHDCRVGSCGTCRCRLKSGQIKELADFDYALSMDDLEAGFILACQSELRSDVVVDVTLAENTDAFSTVSTHQAVIKHTKPLTHDIIELVLKIESEELPRTAWAGQYAELAVAAVNGARSYSFAKAPENEQAGEVTFYIRKVIGGEFTEWLFAGNRQGEAVSLTLPFGSFWLRPAKGAIVCVAGGSGMAPVKSLLESAANSGSSRDVLFLFGARTEQDLYCLDEMAALQKHWNGRFRFVPVLSEEAEDSDWQGARGMVTDYLKQHYIDNGKLNMSTSEAYLCGPPGMVDAAIALFESSGMTKSGIYFDKFLDASSMPGGRV